LSHTQNLLDITPFSQVQLLGFSDAHALGTSLGNLYPPPFSVENVKAWKVGVQVWFAVAAAALTTALDKGQFREGWGCRSSNVGCLWSRIEESGVHPNGFSLFSVTCHSSSSPV
jgi:hypothetical protein